MIPPVSARDLFAEAVTLPKAQATSTAPYRQPPPKQPLTGRAIIFDAKNDYAIDSFLDIIVDPSLTQWVRDVMEKLLKTTAGPELLEALSEMLYDRKTGKYTTKIHLMYVGEAHSGIGEECGSFNTMKDVTEYWVTLKRYAWVGAPLITAGTGAGMARCGARYPPNADKRAYEYSLCFEDDPVAMGVECVYHELAHIWFVKGGAKRARLKQGLAPVTPTYPTGHEIWGKGQFEPDFRDMILKMVDELNAPHAEALKAYEQMFPSPTP